MTKKQAQKKQARELAFRAVLEKYGLELTSSHSGAEDAEEYLSGSKPIRRFCAITTSSGDGGRQLVYAYADSNTRHQAFDQAVGNIDDPDFAESPVAVVDLDTRETWEPDFSTIQWNSVQG